jgi:hypothetical protein
MVQSSFVWSRVPSVPAFPTRQGILQIRHIKPIRTNYDVCFHNTRRTVPPSSTKSLSSWKSIFDAAGFVELEVSTLFTSYGGVRYSSGATLTAKDFTSQPADSLTGLDYYGARHLVG